MNRVVHFEIHASEPEKLAKFYADAFGWTVNRIPQLDYWILDTGTGDGISGGLIKRRGPAAAVGAPVNAFVCSLGVDSLDAVLKRAIGLGAVEAVPKHAIPGVGYQAYIRDPDENIVGLHQRDANAK